MVFGHCPKGILDVENSQSQTRMLVKGNPTWRFSMREASLLEDMSGRFLSPNSHYIKVRWLIELLLNFVLPTQIDRCIRIKSFSSCLQSYCNRLFKNVRAAFELRLVDGKFQIK